MNKEYLGDGLYVDYDEYQIRLYTDNGIHITNEVFLEPNVLQSFISYLNKNNLIVK